MCNRRYWMTASVLTFALGLLLATASSGRAQAVPGVGANKCLAGKNKCVAKKIAGLLKCRATCQQNPRKCGSVQAECEANVRDKFDGGVKPQNGCFAKLEAAGTPSAKPDKRCTTTGDADAMEALADAAAGLVVGALETAAPPTVTPTASALDDAATIADVYAFRSYEPGRTDHVTLIMTVDPFQEPARGLRPFDPDVLYALNVDNDQDVQADVVFEFRFATEVRLPNPAAALLGVAGGVVAPANSPPPVDPGALIVPPRVDEFSDVGLGVRQTYTVTRESGGVRTEISAGAPRFVVPGNAGPRTMDYEHLFVTAVYNLPDTTRVFAGTVDDPRWMDQGGVLDTLNTAKSPPILSNVENVVFQNLAADSRAGFNVNAIVLEVPIAELTATGAIEPATSPAATIGVWATTSRPIVKLLPAAPGNPTIVSTDLTQVDRMGNPLIAELLIGNAFKESFRMGAPANDAGLLISLFFDPVLARIVNALTAGLIAIPAPQRLDLLPLFTYAPPIAAVGTTAGPIADLLRLNTGVSPTAPGFINPRGLLEGDPAGFPNGRRLGDDGLDTMLRLVAGGVLAAPFAGYDPNLGNRLGDGVNVNDVPYRVSFPYVASAHSGRSRRHIDPGEPGCAQGLGGACLP